MSSLEIGRVIGLNFVGGTATIQIQEGQPQEVAIPFPKGRPFVSLVPQIGDLCLLAVEGALIFPRFFK